jgi:hypothetical protein
MRVAYVCTDVGLNETAELISRQAFDAASSIWRSRLERAVKALDELLEVQDEACRIDHNGNCQNHYIEKPCRVGDAREVLPDLKQFLAQAEGDADGV